MSKLLKEESCSLRGRERNRKALLRGLFSNNRGNSTLGNKRYINDQIMLQKEISRREGGLFEEDSKRPSVSFS
jgi:hypothetical protein